LNDILTVIIPAYCWTVYFNNRVRHE